MKDWLLTSLLLLGLILSGCGGSGGESETTLTQEDTQLIKSTLDDLGFGDLSILTNDQISQITSELKGRGFSDNDIDALFKELNINQTDGEEIDEQPSFVSFDSGLINIWASSNDQYHLHIGDRTMTVYNNFGSCSFVETYTLSGINNGEMSLINPITNQHYDQPFIFENDLLSFTPPNGVHSEFTSSTFIPSVNGCNNDKTVTIDLALRALPSQIKANKGPYRWYIGFDINKTGIIDNGDIRAQIIHRADSSSDETIGLEGFQSRVLYTNERPDGVVSHRSSSRQAFSYAINDSILQLIFTNETHALVELISADTPVFISTFLAYPDPEREVFGNNQSNLDGPWLWSESSDIHTDRFPEEGYINAGNGITHQDLLDDQVGEAGWIDIDNVSITITPTGLQ